MSLLDQTSVPSLCLRQVLEGEEEKEEEEDEVGNHHIFTQNA